MDASQVSSCSEECGKIVVKIFRGRDSEEKYSVQTHPPQSDAPDTSVSSKAVIKDNNVSHSVR